jgi:hypothetical protein
VVERERKRVGREERRRMKREDRIRKEKLSFLFLGDPTVYCTHLPYERMKESSGDDVFAIMHRNILCGSVCWRNSYGGFSRPDKCTSLSKKDNIVNIVDYCKSGIFVG